uniref:mucin-17-like isoform X1 n=1 Tax=Styela clava TaxID=7725 RepID=UPI001939D837|nr:mucin-17-like isoform X1 [Styela clava]
MKPSGPYGDPGSSLPRYSGQHGGSVPTTGSVSHSPYLTQHQSIPTMHPSFSSLGLHNSASSPRGSRDYHSHHHVPGEDLQQHRGHLGGTPSLGVSSGHMPQRRRTSGQRLSLLWDIGAAGRGERDRAESSVGSLMPQSYSGTGSGSVPSSHVISGPGLYSGRPNMSMLSSMGGLHSSQKALIPGSVPSQSSSATPPRHITAGGPGQSSRTASSSIHQQHPPYLISGNPASVKSEQPMASYVKEESNLSKSPMSIQSHNYPPQLIHSQTHPVHQSQHPGSSVSAIKAEPHTKEVENMPAKETLLASMDKVDKEIQKVCIEIRGLERKKQQLENTAKKPPPAEKSASPKKVEPKHRDLWQVIYAENKKKAEAARGMLDHLCKQYEMPLYNQPCDTKVYQDNLKKNEEMRPKLLAYFQRRSQLSNIRERYLCARYDQLMSEWQKKIEKIENNPKRKVKDAKVREFFEKQFPEIRKQREQQERFSRTGTRGDACRSEADFNEIVDGLSEQEHQEQHMRQLAVVPPMLLDRDERRLKFINNNGLVSDPLEDYKKRQELDHWDSQEKQIFKEKYVQHPKNFHMISSFLEKKTVADCVLFYYLSKKSVGYKQLVRKNNLKPRKVKNVRNQTQQASTTSQDIKNGGQSGDKSAIGDKDSEQKRESPETIVKTEEIERIDRPPSPRITRSRNKNMNWTDEDIAVAKEGFVKHGKDFAAISRLFANKSELQVKNFYHNYKKKHNLDQLILDGKKKKPNEGSRRTRTQNQSQSSTPSIESKSPLLDEDMAADDSRPKSADPQVSTTEIELSKKRKKEDEKLDKKEEPNQVQTEKPASNIPTITTTETETSGEPVSRVTTPVSLSSQIRTRRTAAGSAGTEVTRSEAAKRSPESTTADEPAEKKAKKSVEAEEVKDENKEQNEVDKKESLEVEGAKPTEKVENKPQETMDEKTITESKSAGKEKETPTATKPENIPAPAIVISSTPASAPGTISSTSPISTISTTKTIRTTIAADTKPMLAPSSEMKPVGVQIQAPIKTQPPHLHVLPPRLLPGRENDGGDSSATCSADEEPNMQDVESNKAGVRKHADSPYAFEDDSSASIKLETSRAPMVFHATPITTVTPATTTKQTPVFFAPPANTERPSSTHPPLQMAFVPQDQKRPQSLPPPPGALPTTNVPISALSFQPTPVVKQQKSGNLRPNSTPSLVPSSMPSVLTSKALPTSAWHLPAHGPFSGHIIGKVPEASEFLSALRNVDVSQSKPPIPASINQPVIVPQSKPIKQDVSQTIDLTVPTARGLPTSEDLSKRLPVTSGKDQHRPQHYHPVPQEATSLQKDFLAQKIEVKVKEDPAPISRPHKYSHSDVAMMRDRAATIPATSAIPVMSLRAPMPSTSQSRDIRLPEPILKREPNMSVIETGKAMHGLHYPKAEPGKPIQPSLLQQVPISLARSSLTTSSIPTKYVSGSMTSGAPVLQKQPLKQPTPTAPNIESRKLEDYPSGQLPRTADAHIYQRRPEHGQALDGRGHPPELIRKTLQDSRPSIVKLVENLPRSMIEQQLANMGNDQNRGMVRQDVQTVKPPGSITTGLPVNRPQDARHEKRTEIRKDIIHGRDILVQAAYSHAPSLPDPTRASETSLRHEMARMQNYPAIRFSLPGMHPSLIQGLPTKPVSGQGSILDGTPVKRKPSDDSNSSLSPTSNPAYHGAVVSRQSPTILPPNMKQTERVGSSSNRSASDTRGLHQGYLPKKEDPYHRRTPEKLLRDPSHSSRVASPSHRRTPTGPLGQHLAVKQELQGSPMTIEEMIRRNPAFTTAIPGLLDSHQLAAAAAASTIAVNPDLLRTQFPLGFAPNPDFQNLMQQYQAARLPGFQSPLFLPSWFHTAAPGSPLAPRSPQSDESGRESTAKMLNNDFVTAQLMQGRKPTSALVTAASLFPNAAISTPGLQGVPPLVVSGTGAYHPLATPYAGLQQAGLHYIPGHPALTRSPYPSQFAVQAGKNLAESSLSPSQRPPKAGSPEFIRQRHRSGDPPREFANHPAIKERNSPVSPMGYHSPRGNLSPRDRYTPQGYQQQSPSHSQRSAGSHHPHYPHSSTPSSQPSYHHPAMSKSPHLIPPHYLDAEMFNKLAEANAAAASRLAESRSSPYLAKHNRSGSFDGSIHNRIERSRPDSAGPHPRSLPQSPNLADSIKPPHEYHTHAGRDSQSPKYRGEVKPPPQPMSMTGHGLVKAQPKKDERSMHRSSPRPSQKSSAERIEMRQQQSGTPVGSGYHGEPSSTPQKQRTHSPYPTQQQQQIKEGPGRSHAERIPGHGHASSENYKRNVSKNPGEDLKRSGRTKMRAATFIDHIIHREFSDEKSEMKQPSPSEQQQSVISMKQQRKTESPTVSRQSEKAQTHVKPPISASESQPSSQGRLEPENKPIAPSMGTMGSYAVHPFAFAHYAAAQAMANGGQLDKTKTTQSLPMAQGKGPTFAEHSADVIHEYYRTTAAGDRNMSPVPNIGAGSPRSSKSIENIPMQASRPVTPPDRRHPVASQKQDVKIAPPLSSYQQQQFHTRLPISTGVAVLPVDPSLMGEARPAIPLQRMPITSNIAPQPTVAGSVIQQQPTPSSSLEEIIRKALLTDAAPTTVPDLQVQDKVMSTFSPDMMVQHAMLSSARVSSTNVQPPSQQLPQAQPLPKPEPRRDASSQPQSGSEKYMSALMFRQIPGGSQPQNTQPPAAQPHERQQQFYQSIGGRPNQPTASQSPAPAQEPAPQQQRYQAPAIQYEALSD